MRADRSRARAWARAALVLLAALIAPAAAESPSAISYPQGYRTHLVRYAVVDRADGTSRDLYASRSVVDAVARDLGLRDLPVGAVLALDVWSARAVGRDAKTQTPRFERTARGQLARSHDERTLHLMQKIRTDSGSGNWIFEGFDPLTAAKLKLKLPGDCLLCHQAAVVSDMTFSMRLLKRFVETGVVQYSFCQHPGRQLCPF